MNKMGRVLIEQPNGKVMLWSSIVDAPIAFDMTLDDYIEFKTKEARQEAIETFNNYKRNSDYLFDLLFCYKIICKNFRGKCRRNNWRLRIYW